MDDILTDRAKVIRRRLNQPSIDPELKLEATRYLRPVRGDLEDLRRDDGYEDHLLWYINREAERHNADEATLAELDADEPRHKRLCTCRDGGCALCDGRLPPTVKEAESIDKGIRRFRESHTGTPYVLDEAREAWQEKQAEVHDRLDVVLISLANGIPVSELTDDTDGDAADDDGAETDADADADEPLPEPATTEAD